VFVLLVVALLGTLLGRLAVVQIGEHDDYARAATRVNTRVIVQPAIRGRILDATRKPLAGNTSAVSVTVDRAVLLAARDGGRDLIGRVVAPSWSDGPVWRRSMTRFFVGSVAVPPCPSTPEVLSQARSRPPTRSPAKISSLT